jgi:hypothetical protein
MSCLKKTYNFDIINDPELSSSNIVFMNKLKHLKSIGKGAAEDHPDISESDLKKVVQNLSPDNPTELQLLVWFNLQLYFCRRGLENADHMMKDHYEVKLVDNKRILVQKYDEMSKNHREKDTDRAYGGVVEEQGHEKCPVALFTKYVSKLQPCSPYLWQLPCKATLSAAEYWYERKAGVKTIGNFMKSISKICSLSKIYTNHCVRSTTCTILGKYYSDINVQAVSGHKSLSGLSHYKRVDDIAKKSMSQTLSTYLTPSTSNNGNASLNLLKLRESPKHNSLISNEIVDLDDNHDEQISSPSSDTNPHNTTHNNCCISYGLHSKATSSLPQICDDVDAPTNNAITSSNAGKDVAKLVTSMNHWNLIPDDWNDPDVNHILSAECEKVEKSTARNVLFNNCTNCTFNNITSNFQSN